MTYFRSYGFAIYDVQDDIIPFPVGNEGRYVLGGGLLGISHFGSHTATSLCFSFPGVRDIPVYIIIHLYIAQQLGMIFIRVAGIQAIDLLSIDIDSDDYAVWQSVTDYRPAVVIIEYNPTIPFDVRYVNPRGRNHGNSALALVELGREKGYDLVAGTRANLVFVDAEKRPASMPAITLQDLKDAVGGGFRFFFAMDGTLLREAGHTIRETEVYRIPWTDYVAPQPLPRFLRRFDARAGLKKALSAVTLLVTRPGAVVHMLRQRASTPRPEERQIYEKAPPPSDGGK